MVGVDGRLPGQLAFEFASTPSKARGRRPRDAQSGLLPICSALEPPSLAEHESQTPVRRHSAQRARCGLAGVPGHAVPGQVRWCAAQGFAGGTGEGSE